MNYSHPTKPGDPRSPARPPLLPCGHPESAAVTGGEGTSYCGVCASPARPEDAITAALHLLSEHPDIEASAAHEAWLNGSAALAALLAEREEREEALDEARADFASEGLQDALAYVEMRRDVLGPNDPFVALADWCIGLEATVRAALAAGGVRSADAGSGDAG